MPKFYKTVILEKPFIFRQIKRKEYEGLRARSQYGIEDQVCKLAVMDPEDVDWEDIEAGIPTTLYNEILRVSGFGDAQYVNSLVSTEIDRISVTPHLWLDAVIQHVYPHCTDEYLRELTMEETITLYAKAAYTIKFLQREKTMVEFGVIQEIQEEIAKNQPAKTPQMSRNKHGKNVYNM